MWLSSLPFFQLAWGQWDFRLCSAFSIPLPPEVAKGITVLPEKSYLSRNVSTIRGSTYHQMGKPTNTVSYWSRSAAGAAMAGRQAGSFISSVLRLFWSIQFRSAAV